MRKVAIVGGGASGAALAWNLTRDEDARRRASVTLFHDEPRLGGHSLSIDVELGGVRCPIDIGVQLVSPRVYPNLFAMLSLPEFSGHVSIAPLREMRVSTVFTETLNWGNFPEYQRGERFAVCSSPEVRSQCAEFARDVLTSPFATAGGATVLSQTLGEYFQARPHRQGTIFYKYILAPILSILNGYGMEGIFETKMQDLFPLFLGVPHLLAPLCNLSAPNGGWVRFDGGAQTWIDRMGELSLARGASIRAGSLVTRITPGARHVEVAWRERGAETTHSEHFDDVVLTTDMTTNRSLLGHGDNPFWARQLPFLSEDRFRLMPGICYIHQDRTLLSPHVGDELEHCQFNGHYSWNEAEGNAYGLEYDLESTYNTFLCHNIQGTPERCYVSMYAEAKGSRLPRAETVLHEKRWRHGRLMSSFFRRAKEELHVVQGLGRVWFAGNNTTMDSEEGALLSALIVAEKLCGLPRSPFSLATLARHPLAPLLQRHFGEMMFPEGWERRAAQA